MRDQKNKTPDVVSLIRATLAEASGYFLAPAA
jgi:hypothetical protein